MFDGFDRDRTLDQAGLALGLHVGGGCGPASGQSQRDDKKQERDHRSIECLGSHRWNQVDSVAVIDSPDIRSLRALGFSNNATPSAPEGSSQDRGLLERPTLCPHFEGAAGASPFKCMGKTVFDSLSLRGRK